MRASRARQRGGLVRVVPHAKVERDVRAPDEVCLVPKLLQQDRHTSQRHARRRSASQLPPVPLELQHVDRAATERACGAGEDVDVDDDGRASFEDKPQRPTPVGGQSIWNLFSPVKEETPAPEKRRDSAMSLATPNNDDMSLASPEKPVAARHVADGVGINLRGPPRHRGAAVTGTKSG